MKKIFCVLFAAMIMLSAASFTENREVYDVSGCITVNAAKTTGDYQYVTNGNNVTITKYTGSDVSVVVPSKLGGKTVTAIGDGAFKNNSSIQSLTLPDTIQKIVNGSLTNCKNLKTLTIKSKSFVFTNNDLNGFFAGTTKLQSVNVPSSHTKYITVDGVVFSKDKKTLILFPSGKAQSYNIPNTVTSIGKYAFCNNTKLITINIPGSVKTVNSKSFVKCSSLMRITLLNGVQTVEDGAFTECKVLSDLMIPKSVTKMSDQENYFKKYCNTDFTIYGDKDSYAYQYALKNNYRFSDIAKRFTVIPITYASVTLNKTEFTYNNTDCKPKIWDISIQKNELLFLKDYTVTYQNNRNAGTGKLIITGKGDYFGTMVKTFTIKPQAVPAWVVQYNISGLEKTYTYTGKSISPNFSIKGYKKGTDYTVSYENNKNIGITMFTIKFIGNYSGSYIRSFTITPPKVNLKSVTSTRPSTAKNFYQARFTATWTTNNIADGYQLQYSRNKNFATYSTATIKNKNISSKTINNCYRGETVYVRVRSFKDVNSRRIYSDFSTVKSIKIK